MPASPSLSRFARRQVQLAKRMLPGQLSKYATSLGTSLALTTGTVKEGGISESGMSARFVISTRNRDREGDIVEPRGVILKNYTTNPVVFYDHDSSAGSIGDAARDGKLYVDVFDDRIESTCWFHGKTLLSNEVFGLVAAGVLRMASIGFLPIEGERLPGKGHRFVICELTEWGPTWLGVNAEALRLHLDKGRVKSMGLRKSLETFAAGASKSAPKRGVKPMSAKLPEVVTKAGPDDDDWEDDDIDVNDKTGPAEEAAQDATAADDAADKDDVPADEEKPAEEKEKAVEEDDVIQEPDHAQRHGAQALGTLAAINKAYAEQLQTMLAEHDNPNLRTFLEAELASRNELLPKLEELLGQDYPGLNMEDVMPSMDAPEKPEEELPNEEVTKTKAVKTLTVKRLNKAHKSVVTDAKDFLAEMGQEPKVPKSLQGSCRYHAKGLGDMMDGMEKERDAENGDEMTEEVAKALRLDLRGVRKELRA